MAKDQDLPVNPMRIAGACGRLMCCLKYEHPLYAEFRDRAPRLGADVDSPQGTGTVVGYTAVRQGPREAQRGRPQVRVQQGERLRAPAGL